VAGAGIAAQPTSSPNTTHTVPEKRSLERRIVTPPRLSDYRTKTIYCDKNRMTIRAALNYLFYRCKISLNIKPVRLLSILFVDVVAQTRDNYA
jgi:hypothetical protein